MKRGGPLRRDPEKARAWRKRSRKPLSRKQASLRRTPMKRKPRKPRPPEGPLDPLAYKAAVYRAAGGRDAVTGRFVSLYEGEAHHPLPKRVLRREGLHGRVYDPRNGVWLAAETHAAHENGSRRITRDLLPESVWEFADELPSWARYEIERTHPEPTQREENR